MKQVLQYPKRGQLRVEEVPAPASKLGGVTIQNGASLLSAGTERAIIEMAEKTIIGKARQRPDLVRQVIEKVKTEGLMNTYRKVKTRLDAPLPLGYSCAGIVQEVSPEITDITVGQRVAAAGFGYASHADMVFVPSNLTAPIPDNVSLEEASFVTVGAIALQGVRQANPTLGERIAVIGMGLLGQLTAQMLKANGCMVIGMDIDDEKLTLAKRLGCAHTINSKNSSTVSDVMMLTAGVGVDRVIITAGASSSSIINQAAEICRDRGQVTVVGAVGMELDRKPFYDKELSLNLSRSYGPGRYDTKYEEQGQDYPIGYVRWTERRNMICFLEMISSGQVNVSALITHRFAIEDAATGYDLIMGRTPGSYLGVVLTYSQENNLSSKTKMVSNPAVKKNNNPERMNLSALGAGNFSTGVLYPILQGMKNVSLGTVVATNGVKAMNVSRQFGFAGAGTSVDEALADSSINAILIATPHNLHAEQVIASLDAGKDVFVEKPLATDTEELEKVNQAYRRNPGKLMVGLNRRFSPAALATRKEMMKLDGPAMYQYRINAGFIPKDNPLQDDKIGKGRIIGEVCHFVDLINFLSDSLPVSVQAIGVGFKEGQYLSSDNAQINMRLADGSTAMISYVACGGAGLPKELLEVHCQGTSIVIDDFILTEMYRNGSVKKLHSGAQDKGHANELKMFSELQRDSLQMNELTESAFVATKVTFAIVESMRTGRIVQLDYSFNKE